MSEEEHNELEYRRELMGRITDGGACPMCHGKRVIYKTAVSDFPGYMTRLLSCNDCGAVIFWEEEVDSAGNRLKAYVTKYDLPKQGLRSSH